MRDGWHLVVRLYNFCGHPRSNLFFATPFLTPSEVLQRSSSTAELASLHSLCLEHLDFRLASPPSLSYFLCSFFDLPASFRLLSHIVSSMRTEPVAQTSHFFLHFCLTLCL
eukprot:m.76489 g.76489  ORF g.76489 m.76489 type:complete len:111 (-) comp8113_c1_seq1:362-694(-)